jgi:hypothetical protein
VDPEIDRIDLLLEEVLGPPPEPPSSPKVTARSLDHILGSRTHVRVLRVLVALDRGINLTARGVARRAAASHGRVLETLRNLVSAGIVTAHRTPTHSIYCLSDDHPLTAPVRSLFDTERNHDAL